VKIVPDEEEKKKFMADKIILNILAIFGYIFIVNYIFNIISGNFLLKIRIKLALILIGKTSLVANFHILSGHLVPKAVDAYIENNTFGQDVMICGQDIADLIPKLKRKR
jgi:hypothetical protein